MALLSSLPSGYFSGHLLPFHLGANIPRSLWQLQVSNSATVNEWDFNLILSPSSTRLLSIKPLITSLNSIHSMVQFFLNIATVFVSMPTISMRYKGFSAGTVRSLRSAVVLALFNEILTLLSILFLQMFIATFRLVFGTAAF